jgi:hypothetical protein
MGESDTLIWLKLITSSISDSQVFLILFSPQAYESVSPEITYIKDLAQSV